MRQNWVSNELCLLGDVQIKFVSGNFSEAKTTADQMIVLKPQIWFERYKTFIPTDVRRIVEVGIFEGGSIVLLADLFPNAEIIGIDLRKQNDFVLQHIDALGYGDRVKLHYGVSQTDRAAIEQIISSAWGAEPIDLVIDDASHVYDFSVATFDILFPRVRAGGFYVLEDWGWAHWPNFSGDLANSGSRALSSMVLELVMATAGYSQAVAEVRALTAMAFIKRGEGAALPLGKMIRLNGNNRVWHGV